MIGDIVLVGAGNMGFAMLDGWLKTSSARFHVVEPFEPLRARCSECFVVLRPCGQQPFNPPC